MDPFCGSMLWRREATLGFKNLIAELLRRANNPTGKDPDRLVLHQLRVAGANLEKPTHVRFYIYAPDEEGARRIAAAACADAVLTSDVRPSADGAGWLCLLQGSMIPTYVILKDYRSRFEAYARIEGGEYDGWEAAVTK
jgi:hypothetical protein